METGHVGTSPQSVNHKVLTLAAADTIGAETRSRNLEVVHAGISYSQATSRPACASLVEERCHVYRRERAVAAAAIGKLSSPPTRGNPLPCA